MRVLLDTNVLASGIAGRGLDAATPPARIWQRWRAGEFDLLLSQQVQDELQRVLILPWFTARLSDSDRALALVELAAFSETVEVIAPVSRVASHWQDDLVLAAAVSGNADFLVTRDKAFRQVGEYGGVKIRTPAEFLIELDAASESR